MEHLSSELSATQKTFEVKFEVLLDPLEWIHSDVHELIFQHFKPEDSLRASLVSRAWNKSTEASKKCWEKLELVISNEKIKKINRTIAEDFKSSRKYQKLYLNGFNDVSGIMSSVILGRKWRSVKMKHVECELVQLKEILKIVEPTVETQHIEDSDFSWGFNSSPNNSADEYTMMLKYPKLKDLRLKDCEGLPLEAVAGDCKTLEKLAINFRFSDPAVYDISFLNSLDKILENNAKLKELSFWVHDEAAPFPIRSTLNHRFELKYLYFNSPRGWVDVEDRFLSFLKSQANNLEELRVQPVTGVETIKAILNLSKLKKVDLFLDHELIADWNNVDFNQNVSIRNVKLNFPSDFNDSIIESLKLFKSIKNCQHLNVYRLNGANLRSIAERYPRIKKLEVNFLEVRNINELPDFPAIDVFECEPYSIYPKLLKQIRAKPEETRTRMEMLILQAYEKK